MIRIFRQLFFGYIRDMKGKKNHHIIILGYLLDSNLKSHKICSVSWMVVHFISVDNLHVMIIRDFGVLLFTYLHILLWKMLLKIMACTNCYTFPSFARFIVHSIALELILLRPMRWREFGIYWLVQLRTLGGTHLQSSSGILDFANNFQALCNW